MSDASTAKVPLLLLLLGWFLILGGLVFVAKIAILGSDFDAARGAWNGTMKALAVAAGIGFLKLRRWAVYLYFSTFAVSTVVFFVLPPSEEALALYLQPVPIATFLLAPAVVALIVWRHWARLA